VRTKVGLISVFSLIILMIVPAYANVTSIELGKSFYTVDEKISFLGTESEGSVLVNVIVRDPNGKSKLVGGFSDPEGGFETISQSVESIFSLVGIYNATAFVYKIENGTSLLLEFDGKQVFEVPDFVLQLKTIADKSVEVEKTISFTASLLDSSVKDAIFSLDDEPTGATIDPSSGKFVWTPSKSHGSIQDVHYSFDVVVKKGAQEDRETIIITVNQAYVEPEVTQPSEDDQVVCPEGFFFKSGVCVKGEEPVTESAEKELEIPAPFVDESKNPQSYVDRYNSDANYKKWFDNNYSEYSSIYEAIGLEEPKELAPFVDPNQEPQHYIDRYNNEITYKKWFDKTYPEYISIYEAVGLVEPIVEEPEFGECGEGTKLIDGKCTVVVTESEGGGCLIATATFGSEMAPQVQFLREIRDNQLMNTDSGISFMTGFNQLYYSFSPAIADMQRENPVFKEVVKIGITPLLSSLSIMSHAESESQVLGYGIGIILMNVGMYFIAPAMLFYGIRKLRRARF